MNTLLLPPILIFAFFAFVIILIIRAAARAASGDGPVSAQPEVTTQIAEDGFWILACPAEPEDVIYYRYWVKGARHAGQVSFQPDKQGRQFVYTGEQPERVAIVRIVSQAENASPSILPPIIGSTSSMWADDPPSQPSSPPSSSFPSAY